MAQLCLWTNVTILLVYIPAKITMSFIWKDDFFCQNRHLLLVDLRCTSQRCSFGGRIKLIICQTRHELNVTIHEISISWKKKNIRWRTLYKYDRHKEHDMHSEIWSFQLMDSDQFDFLKFNPNSIISYYQTFALYRIQTGIFINSIFVYL